MNMFRACFTLPEVVGGQDCKVNLPHCVLLPFLNHISLHSQGTSPSLNDHPHLQFIYCGVIRWHPSGFHPSNKPDILVEMQGLCGDAVNKKRQDVRHGKQIRDAFASWEGLRISVG